jgi:hypothetical protein
MPNDAIAYIRVSSEEQADSGLGMEAQRQRIAAYCTMKGLAKIKLVGLPANILSVARHQQGEPTSASFFGYARMDHS